MEVGASQNSELLSLSQVFQGQFAPILEHGSERGYQAKEHVSHRGRGCHLNAKTSMVSVADGISAKDRVFFARFSTGSTGSRHGFVLPAIAEASRRAPYHPFWDKIGRLKLTDFKIEVLLVVSGKDVRSMRPFRKPIHKRKLACCMAAVA